MILDLKLEKDSLAYGAQRWKDMKVGLLVAKPAGTWRRLVGKGDEYGKAEINNETWAEREESWRDSSYSGPGSCHFSFDALSCSIS